MDEVYEESQGFSSWIELLLTVVVTLVLAVLIRVFIAETFMIPSPSMLDTIQEGDRLVGEKVSLHFSSPKAGDIVTFESPGDESKTLIKRVIATEGQEVDLQDGMLFIDGELQEEEYVSGRPTNSLEHVSYIDEDIVYPYVVPEGHVWVMGDNRTNSTDSRAFGAIPISSITSRALFIYWPFSRARIF